MNCIVKNCCSTLKEARDILLPRLMSGAIDVEEVEEEMLSMAAEPVMCKI